MPNKKKLVGGDNLNQHIEDASMSPNHKLLVNHHRNAFAEEYVEATRPELEKRKKKMFGSVANPEYEDAIEKAKQSFDRRLKNKLEDKVGGKKKKKRSRTRKRTHRRKHRRKHRKKHKTRKRKTRRKR